MARGLGTQPTSVVLTVPRHASAAASENLINQVRKVAQEEGKHFANDFGGTPQTARSRAMSQASEWNSLLVSARAARGPQWDVGIQQYLTDKESDLYYDPTPLSQTDTPIDAEAQDASELGPGMMHPNNEVPMTLNPRFAEDAPMAERRRTRAGGGF